MAFTSEQVISAFCYASSSVLILIFNKIILSEFEFKFPVIMTLIHQLVCVVLLSIFKKLNIISFVDIDLQTLTKALPLSICFVLNIVVGMAALSLISIPMFSTLRRLTVLIVIVSEYMLLGKISPPPVITSVCVMGLGALVGGWSDLEFNLLGYLFVFANDAITAAYLTLVKRTFNDSKYKNDTFGVLYLNSVASIPFLVVLSFITNEIFTVADYPYLTTSSFQVAFFGAALLSFALNYFIFWCTAANSPLTTSVTGQVKNALCTFVSLIAFRKPWNYLFLTGLTIGVVGSMMYARAIYKQSDADTKSRKDNQLTGENANDIDKNVEITQIEVDRMGEPLAPNSDDQDARESSKLIAGASSDQRK